MDVLLNNEGIVSYASIYLLKLQPCDFTKLSLQLSLLMDDEVRSRLMAEDSMFFEMSLTREISDMSMSRLYYELLPVCLNSLVTLIQNGIVRSENNVLSLLPKGIDIYEESKTIESLRLNDIHKSVPRIIQLTTQYGAVDLLKTLMIAI